LSSAVSSYSSSEALQVFLTTNSLENIPDPNILQGFLFKRGKTLGAWKARYFVIAQGQLLYSDTIDTDILGSVDLKHIKVARYVPKENDTDQCHGFVVTEYKPTSSTPKTAEDGMSYVVDMKPVAKHILCCESDQDRDLWVMTICKEILKYRPRDKAILTELANVQTEGKSPAKPSDSPGSRWIGDAIPRTDSLPAVPSKDTNNEPLHPFTSPETKQFRPNLPPRLDSAPKMMAASPEISREDQTGSTTRSGFSEEQERIMQQKSQPFLKDQVGERLVVAVPPQKEPSAMNRPSLWKYIKGKGNSHFSLL
jgi:hypothetical protein